MLKNLMGKGVDKAETYVTLQGITKEWTKLMEPLRQYFNQGIAVLALAAIALGMIVTLGWAIPLLALFYVWIFLRTICKS